MFIRSGKLPIMCEVSRERWEELLSEGMVGSKFREVTETKIFRSKLDMVVKYFEKLKYELKEKGSNCKQLEELISRKYILENIRLSTIVSAINMVAESIIFDGVPSNEAIANVITEDFMIKILYGVMTVLEQEVAINISQANTSNGGNSFLS